VYVGDFVEVGIEFVLGKLKTWDVFLQKKGQTLQSCQVVSCNRCFYAITVLRD
jgi:hypothetical protein